MAADYIKGTISYFLELEVEKLIRRYGSFSQKAAKRRRLYEKRSGATAKERDNLAPAHWRLHPHFDPFYVRPRIESLAHAISKKIRDRSYALKPSLTIAVRKPDGGTRDISIFTIPDAAVSHWLASKVIKRNSHFFSSYCYAYRADRNAHHAIQHLMGAIRGQARLFALEYDFAKYFDSIDHAYLRRMIGDLPEAASRIDGGRRTHGTTFLVSAAERDLIDKFLINPRARGPEAYLEGNAYPPDRGIPQGTSISLFLANVACYELDLEIERAGATFARYADDTLVICDSYEKADKCAKLIFAHGLRSGAEVNFSKSAGINLMTQESVAEIRSKKSVLFLSHSLSAAGVAISDRAIGRIKRRVARIIYDHLLIQPKRGQQDPKRFGRGFRDWDLVTCINEIRRYLYGSVTESYLREALDGKKPLHLARCAMSFFPTSDQATIEKIRSLDGWLLDVLHRCYRKRTELLGEIGINVYPLAREKILSGEWYRFAKVHNETELPSFLRSWMYVRRCAKVFGLTRFPSPDYGY